MARFVIYCSFDRIAPEEYDRDQYEQERTKSRLSDGPKSVLRKVKVGRYPLFDAF